MTTSAFVVTYLVKPTSSPE